MQVSLDGGVTYQQAPNGVRIIYEDVPLVEPEDFGELHINATAEGLIYDAWVARVTEQGVEDINVGTRSDLVTDIAFQLSTR